jgi:hypothetical protein
MGVEHVVVASSSEPHTSMNTAFGNEIMYDTVHTYTQRRESCTLEIPVTRNDAFIFLFQIRRFKLKAYDLDVFNRMGKLNILGTHTTR